MDFTVKMGVLQSKAEVYGITFDKS